MRFRSLALATDVALLELGGSVVEEGEDHVIVRTPRNPQYWWGNFLVARAHFEDAQRWDDTCVAAFPDSTHVAVALDDDRPVTSGLTLCWIRAGLLYTASIALTAAELAEPPHPHRTAVCRPLTSDADWGQSAALQQAGYGRDDPEGYRVFLENRVRTTRGLVEAGHGQWFGAFVGGRMLCGMGLFAVGDGLATFQDVDTHPGARRQGLAGTLMHHVARWGLAELGAQRLVVVADAGDEAIRLYRTLGFVDDGVLHQFDRDR